MVGSNPSSFHVLLQFADAALQSQLPVLCSAIQFSRSKTLWRNDSH